MALPMPWERYQPKWETQMFYVRDDLFGVYGDFKKMGITEEKFREIVKVLIKYEFMSDEIEDAI